MSSTATTIEIPATLTEAFTQGHDPSGFQRWAVESLVLSAVGEGLVTTGHAAELLGLGYFETLALIKRRGVPNPTTEEDVERDREDLRRISAALDRR